VKALPDSLGRIRPSSFEENHMNHYDAIIVGGGVMGCAAAWHLARDGRRALLLEQFALGHTNGSSHGHSRIIRLAYHAPEYVHLARAAYPLWRALEAETGEALLLQTGGLDLGMPGTATFEATRATLAAAGVPFEILDTAALASRYPQFHPPEGALGIYQAEAGILDADRCLAALASAARRHGAELRANEPALEIAPDGGGALVRTAVASYRADRLILAAGSWMRPLAARLGLDLPLTVTREQVAFFAPRDPEAFAPGRFPIFIHHSDDTPAGYGFPIFGLPGVKVAFHGGGPAIAPDDTDRAVDVGRLAALRSYVARLLPACAGEPFYSVTCRYTMTPDEDFILDRHPEYPQIVLASPCSGHGFKFGALIGRILADLAIRGASDQPIGRFGLGRFSRRSPPVA
jgi:sarcosine oxidase